MTECVRIAWSKFPDGKNYRLATSRVRLSVMASLANSTKGMGKVKADARLDWAVRRLLPGLEVSAIREIALDHKVQIIAAAIQKERPII